jgi:hypothetical protein
MTTMNVLDAAGVSTAVEKPLTPGRAAAASSRPVVLSTEDIALLGPVTETAPVTDIASSGLNGRLQRIAQNITTLIGSTLAVATHAVTQSGTWTVQPGNTANTTAWKVDGSAVTQPTSVADGSNVTIGAKADAKSSATDATSISAMSVFKQISFYLQALLGFSLTARLASSAASTNATNVKTSAGRIGCVEGKNNAGYDIFLVLYDSATNPPVPGTTTIRKKMVCPAGQAFIRDYPLGLSFANGIGYAFTKLVADASDERLLWRQRSIAVGDYAAW